VLGFAFIPIPFEELKRSLGSARWDKDGSLIESAEMRLMRQTLMRIRSLDIVALPDESPFLEQIQHNCIMVIHNLWLDESVTIEKTVELSNWVWRNIAPNPLEWVKRLREPKNKKVALESFAQHHRFLLKPITLSLERYDAYLKWLEEDLFAPLLIANSDLIDTLAALVSKDIELIVEDISNDRKTNDS
jgi:hypothetical protein